MCKNCWILQGSFFGENPVLAGGSEEIRRDSSLFSDCVFCVADSDPEPFRRQEAHSDGSNRVQALFPSEGRFGGAYGRIPGVRAPDKALPRAGQAAPEGAGQFSMEEF